MKHQLCVTILLLSALLFGGCASYKGGAVQTRDATAFLNSTSLGEVDIGAEAITDATKVKELFYANVTERGYFPIEVAINNRSSSKVYIDRTAIELRSLAGSISQPINVSVMIDDFEKNKMAYALLGFGIFSYMSAEDANKKMAADWSSKELPKEIIVAPGRRTSGFIYVKLPKGEKPAGMELVIEVEALESKERHEFSIRL